MELDSGLGPGPVSGVTPQMYMSKMDGDLTPQQLSKFTEHSIRQLGIGVDDTDRVAFLDDRADDDLMHHIRALQTHRIWFTKYVESAEF